MLVHPLRECLFGFPDIAFLTTTVFITLYPVDYVGLKIFRYLVFRVYQFLSQCIVWLERNWEFKFAKNPADTFGEVGYIGDVSVVFTCTRCPVGVGSRIVIYCASGRFTKRLLESPVSITTCT